MLQNANIGLSISIKQINLMRKLIYLILAIVTLSSCTENENLTTNQHLSVVLKNLQKIKSATYNSYAENYLPWDTLPANIYKKYRIEYSNPTDTLIGACFVNYSIEDTTRMTSCYDGIMEAIVFEEHKRILIDSFKFNPHSFRLVGAPFFTFNENLINYILESTDSLLIEANDYGDHIQFRFTIYDDVVEIIGNQIIHDTMHLSAKGKLSKYAIWVNKSNDLPFKVKRDMPYNKTIEEVDNVRLNTLDISNFVAADFFPADYIIKEYKGNQKVDLKVNKLLTEP